jgi:outer membrane receptor protein involved in Fe transport
VPSLRVAPFYSRNSALIMNIRGIGVLSDSNQPARDQGVGVYVDGVYLGRAQGLGTALYDIENIEVLKGPQGTLFGRNTEGGAINIVTKKPSGEFHANALVGAGNYGSYKGEVHLDLPKWGNLAAKIDGVVSHRDGLVKNPLAGQTDFNFYTKRGLRGEVLWTPPAISAPTMPMTRPMTLPARSMPRRCRRVRSSVRPPIHSNPTASALPPWACPSSPAWARPTAIACCSNGTSIRISR